MPLPDTTTISPKDTYLNKAWCLSEPWCQICCHPHFFLNKNRPDLWKVTGLVCQFISLLYSLKQKGSLHREEGLFSLARRGCRGTPVQRDPAGVWGWCVGKRRKGDLMKCWEAGVWLYHASLCRAHFGLLCELIFLYIWNRVAGNS